MNLADFLGMSQKGRDLEKKIEHLCTFVYILQVSQDIQEVFISKCTLEMNNWNLLDFHYVLVSISRLSTTSRLFGKLKTNIGWITESYP